MIKRGRRKNIKTNDLLTPRHMTRQCDQSGRSCSDRRCLLPRCSEHLFLPMTKY